MQIINHQWSLLIERLIVFHDPVKLKRLFKAGTWSDARSSSRAASCCSGQWNESFTVWNVALNFPHDLLWTRSSSFVLSQSNCKQDAESSVGLHGEGGGEFPLSLQLLLKTHLISGYLIRIALISLNDTSSQATPSDVIQMKFYYLESEAEAKTKRKKKKVTPASQKYQLVAVT